MSELDVLLLTLESITDNNIVLLEGLLEKFPLQTLDVSRSDNLLAQLLNQCSRYNRVEAAKTVYTYWEKSYPSQEIDFFTTLFKNLYLDDDTYKFIASSFPSFSFLSVMTDLCHDDSSENLLRVMDNVFRAYGAQDKDRLEIVRVEADSTGNYVVYNYIVGKLIPLQESAPKPSWVKNFREPAPLPDRKDLEDEANAVLSRVAQEVIAPDLETLIDYLTDGMASAGLSFENIEESRLALRGILPHMTEDELTGLLGERVSETLSTGNLSLLQNDTTLFRVLGPSNPQINSKSEDFLNGQDRMFVSSLYDYDDEEDTTFSWFDGYCLSCMKLIDEYWYAVRVPRSQGGWSGCYCGFSCARSGLLNEEIPKVSDIAILDFMESKILALGIQDRI